MQKTNNSVAFESNSATINKGQLDELCSISSVPKINETSPADGTFAWMYEKITTPVDVQETETICDPIINEPEPLGKKLERIAQKSDAVNHPSHYTYGTIEVIDYIEDKGFNYNLGNAVKYISRAGHKLNAVEDLQKAVWYINREIQRLEKSNG